MEQEMIKHFKAAMDAMSDEDFSTIWNEIKDQPVVGPTAQELIDSWNLPKEVTNDFSEK